MLKLTERYPDRSEPSSANYPYGGPKDDPTSALKGTPWEAATMGEFVGMMSAIVAAAKITPTGNTETAVASDILDALCSMEYYEHANYKANKSIVTGSDGNQYIALIDNGPRSTPVDPVGDTTGTWHQYPFKVVKDGRRVMVRHFSGFMLQTGFSIVNDDYPAYGSPVKSAIVEFIEPFKTGDYSITASGTSQFTVDVDLDTYTIVSIVGVVRGKSKARILAQTVNNQWPLDKSVSYIAMGY